MTIYWDEDWMTAEHARPDILAEGDSWFSYWIPGNGNLINQIDLVWKGRYNILDIAYPGDEAIKMLDGNSYWILQETLRQYDSIKLLLFSGGGNDIAAKNLLSLLEADCSGATDVSECFRDGEPDGRLAQIEHAYRDLVTLRDMYRPEAVIVTHNYDYAMLGKKLLWMAWLDPYLQLASVPRRFRAGIVAAFIDGMETMLNRLAATTSGFEFVKTSGTLGPGDWANELHPTAAGFKKIANCFKPVLLKYLQ
jgi:hypothetical protein